MAHKGTIYQEWAGLAIWSTRIKGGANKSPRGRKLLPSPLPDCAFFRVHYFSQKIFCQHGCLAGAGLSVWGGDMGLCCWLLREVVGREGERQLSVVDWILFSGQLSCMDLITVLNLVKKQVDSQTLHPGPKWMETRIHTNDKCTISDLPYIYSICNSASGRTT